MHKLTLIASMVSVISLALWFVPVSGDSRDVVTHGDQSPATGNIGRDQNIYYQLPPNEQRATDFLPPGFSIDDEGFVLNKSGKRICERRKIRHAPVYDGYGGFSQSNSYETRCRMWDGTYKLGCGSSFCVE